MKKVCLFLFVGALSLSLCVMSASARPPYKKAIDTLASPTDVEAALQAKVKADGCNACHVKDMEKKVRNDYGKKLTDLLPKFNAADWKDDAAVGTKALREAIGKVK